MATSDLRRPLLNAGKARDASKVRSAIAVNTSVNQCCVQHNTALHLTCGNGHVELARMLINDKCQS
jgi:ankyrin repeat protein